MPTNRPGTGRVRSWQYLRCRDALWHRTSIDGLRGIHRDRHIAPNVGQFVSEYGQARVSYSRHLQGVSLLDFDSESIERIEEHDDKWSLFMPMPPRVFIMLARRHLDDSRLLLPADLTANTDPRLGALSDEVRRMRMFVPAIEAIHLGPLPVQSFAGYVMAGLIDGGELRWAEFELNELPDIYETSAAWIEEDVRLRAERHSRQEHTLAEIMERSRYELSLLSREEIAEKRRRTRQALRRLRSDNGRE